MPSGNSVILFRDEPVDVLSNRRHRPRVKSTFQRLSVKEALGTTLVLLWSASHQVVGLPEPEDVSLWNIR
jgi:hypothetical protein